ncbi:MAG TPA: hypothetical protein VI072_35545 [Polyangiaceae bacterium]
MRINKNLARSFAGTCALLGALGCSSEDDTGSARGKYLGLEAPTRGFQIKNLGATVRAGDDIEYCEVAELPGTPGETLYVKSIELGNAAFSHHLILTAALPNTAADANLRKAKIGERVECVSADSAYGQGMIGIHGIQQRYGRLDFPEGVGRVFQGGQRIVFDYHYLNTSEADVEAKSALNLHLADASEVEQIADTFAFYNFTIDIPPGATGSFTGECQFKRDVLLASITRHTHRWGTDFRVWYSGGTRDGAPLWSSQDWEHEVDYEFSEPQLMKTGEGLRFQCDYNNTESHRLRYGTQARDEMCNLFGLAWDAGGDRTMPYQGCSITWLDEQGVGQSASAKGGFPKPTPEMASLCIDGAAAQGRTVNECLECQCNSCADILIKCSGDADCKAILDCVTESDCGSQSECGGRCQNVLDQHSSAIGLMQQVSACVSSRCQGCQ